MSAPLDTEQKWLTVDEAASRLRVTPDLLRRRVSAGLISHHRDGLYLRFTDADLDDYVAATAVPRKPEPVVADDAPAEPIGNPFKTTRQKAR